MSRPLLSAGSFLSVFILALISLPGTLLHAQRRSPPVLVRRVIDGDSIDVATMGRVNLRGIAAPRPGSRGEAKPLGREAHERLSGLLANRWVRLEFENETEHSGRSAYVFLDDGRFVNAWMLREGLARASPQSGLRRSRELLAAESEARSSRRGIWAESHRP